MSGSSRARIRSCFSVAQLVAAQITFNFQCQHMLQCALIAHLSSMIAPYPGFCPSLTNKWWYFRNSNEYQNKMKTEGLYICCFGVHDLHLFRTVCISKLGSIFLLSWIESLYKANSSVIDTRAVFSLNIVFFLKHFNFFSLVKSNSSWDSVFEEFWF